MPVRVFHRTAASSRPVNNRCPFSLNATDLTPGIDPPNARILFPVAESQRIAGPDEPAVKNCLPSGKKQTDLM